MIRPIVPALLFALSYRPYPLRIVSSGLAGFRDSVQRVPLLYAFTAVLGVSMVIGLASCAAGVVPTGIYPLFFGYCLYGAGTSFVRVFLSVARGGAGA